MLTLALYVIRMPAKKRPSATQGNVVNPTQDARSQMGDTYGLTGMTVSNSPRTGLHTPETTVPPESISAARQKSVLDTFSEEDSPLPDPPVSAPVNVIGTPTGNDTLSKGRPPEVSGEQSASGDMPDPEADDDTVLNANVMGIGLDADDEHPQELDIASDFDKGEEAVRRQ